MKQDKREPYKCVKCGSSDTVVFATLYVSMPSYMNRRLVKKDIRSKDFRITGQNHDLTTIFCNSCNNIEEE